MCHKKILKNDRNYLFTFFLIVKIGIKCQKHCQN